MSQSDKRGFIYFLQLKGDGPIKIGFTRGSPYLRAKALQQTSPHELEWVGYFTGVTLDERKAHRKLKDDAIRAEWFHPTQRVKDFIESKCSGFNAKETVARIFHEDLLNEIVATVGRNHGDLELFRQCFPNWEVVRSFSQWRDHTKVPTPMLIKQALKAVEKFRKLITAENNAEPKPKRRLSHTGTESANQ